MSEEKKPVKFGVVQYSDGRNPKAIRRYCRDVLKKTVKEAGGAAIFMDEPNGAPTGHVDIYQRILAGLAIIPKNIPVFLAEDDVIYNKEYFELDSEACAEGELWFNDNIVHLSEQGGYFAATKDCHFLSNMFGMRDTIRRAIQEKLAETNAGLLVWAEPKGTSTSALVPIVDIRHGSNFTGMRAGKQITTPKGMPSRYEFTKFFGWEHWESKPQKAITPPKAEPVSRPECVMADCCGVPHPTVRIRVNGAWHQLVWMPLSKTQVTAMSWPAKICPHCGMILDKMTKTSRYHWDVYPFMDSQVMAIAGE